MHVPERFLLIPHAVTFEVIYDTIVGEVEKEISFATETEAREFMEVHGGTCWFTVSDSDGDILWEEVI